MDQTYIFHVIYRNGPSSGSKERKTFSMILWVAPEEQTIL